MMIRASGVNSKHVQSQRKSYNRTLVLYGVTTRLSYGVREIDPLLVTNQVIWNNRYNMIRNKPMMWNWAESEIYVQDVLDKNDELMMTSSNGKCPSY